MTDKDILTDYAAMRRCLVDIAAQDSGVPGSTSRADCMAALARVVLRGLRAAQEEIPETAEWVWP